MISGEHGIDPSGQYSGAEENQLDHVNVYYNQVGDNLQSLRPK